MIHQMSNRCLPIILLAGIFSAQLSLGLEIRIPKEKPASASYPLANMTHDTIRFMIGLFLRAPEAMQIRQDAESQDQDWVVITPEQIFVSALPAFRSWASAEHYLDVLQELKDYLKTEATHEARHLKHQETPIPRRLSELKDQWHFHDWPHRRVEQSAVKGRPRIVYRNKNQSISVAETLESAQSSEVRETEIILPREDSSGQFDFFVYDKNGLLSNESLFHTKSGNDVPGFAPHTCMTCHYDGRNRVFQRRPLSFHGSGRLANQPVLQQNQVFGEMFPLNPKAPIAQ